MGVTNFPDGLNIGSNASATAVFQLGGTEVAITAAELNAVHNAGGLDATEFDLLDGAIAGTVVASKVVAVDANKLVDVLAITSGTITTATITTDNVTTLVLGGGTVTSSAAELNYIDTSVPGTAIASKALVLGASKNVDTIDVAASGLKIATTAVTATAAELNTLAGALGAKALTYDGADARVISSGSTAITGSGTIATGMANVVHVVGSLGGVVTGGTAAATDAVTLIVDPVTVGGGSVIFRCLGPTGITSTTAGTVYWVAVGTAA